MCENVFVTSVPVRTPWAGALGYMGHPVWAHAELQRRKRERERYNEEEERSASLGFIYSLSMWKETERRSVRAKKETREECQINAKNGQKERLLRRWNGLNDYILRGGGSWSRKWGLWMMAQILTFFASPSRLYFMWHFSFDLVISRSLGVTSDKAFWGSLRHLAFSSAFRRCSLAPFMKGSLSTAVLDDSLCRSALPSFLPTDSLCLRPQKAF